MMGKERTNLKAYIRAKFNTFRAKTAKAEPHLTPEEVRGLWDKMGDRDLAALDLDPDYERR